MNWFRQALKSTARLAFSFRQAFLDLMVQLGIIYIYILHILIYIYILI
jgi:hypothetical protein